MLELLTDPATWASLLTLTAMEIVLGIDNIVFLTILAGKLPAGDQPRARRLGLLLALGTRLLLLFGITWLMGLTRVLFHLLGRGFTGRALILGAGGLFLLGKATHEIHQKLERSSAAAFPCLRTVAAASTPRLQWRHRVGFAPTSLATGANVGCWPEYSMAKYSIR